jgi:hypothetical protein
LAEKQIQKGAVAEKLPPFFDLHRRQGGNWHLRQNGDRRQKPAREDKPADAEH